MELPIYKGQNEKQPGDKGYEQHQAWKKQIETARAAARAQDESLATADIPEETKIKIRDKFIELALKHPHMKRDRLMRKAGEAYHIKFSFE